MIGNIFVMKIEVQYSQLDFVHTQTCNHEVCAHCCNGFLRIILSSYSASYFKDDSAKN